MANRRYGPTLGAGVVIREQDADKPIQQAQLGVTGYMGIMERGPIDMIFLASKKKDYLAKAGGYIPESQLPDCAFDFYNYSNGAGELWLKRITDGTHRNAELVLKSRHSPIRQDVLKIIAAYAGKANPGRWAGKKQVIVKEYVSVTAFTLTTGITMKLNEFKDALLRLSAVPGKSYKVLSNTTAGVLTFAADVNLVADINASPNLLYSLELTNDGRELSIEVIDGEDAPTTEFGLVAYLNGDEVKRYKNLSMDPASANYVEKVINDDSSNYYFKVEDLFIGTQTPAVRPANSYGVVKTITATVLTADIHSVVTSSPGGASAVLSAITYGGSVKKDVLTLTCTTGGAVPVFSVASQLQGALANLTGGTAYPWNEYGMAFTLNDAGTDFSVGDTVTITIDPFPVNGFAGGFLVPDYVNARRTKFQIVSNTVNSITVKTGSDLTSVGAINDQFMVEAPMGLEKGYDGVDAVNDASYIAAWDTATGQFNALFGKNKGFVKLATPGVTATAVQKAGLAYAEAKNYGYRVEIPANIIDESAAEQYINETIGRNDFGKVHFPSYAYVTHPDGQGLKLVSMTGSIHGREALVAKNFDGYHKIAGGIDVTLPNVVKLPTEEKVLDEELLNPAGINVLKFNKGNCIMWGARSISIDPAFRFVQKREQLSHYENVLRENFDYIIFAINNPTARSRVLTSLVGYFQPEFAKGALSGNNFEDAASFKVDDENNTPLTESNGDLNAEIKLRLADTVERFIITIGQAGIFESLAS